MKHNKINNTILPLIAWLIFSFLLGCKDDNRAGDSTKTETPAPDISINLNKEQAIEKVKYEIQRTQKTIAVNVQYWDWENKRVPCSQYDVDRGVRCTGEGVGAPYGYTSKAERVRKCCRQKDIRLYDVQGQWVADFSQPDDKWKVAFEFSVDDVKQIFSWIVADKTGQVSEN